MEKNNQLGYDVHKIIQFLVVLILWGLCWTISVSYKRSISDYYGSVSVRFEDASPTRKKIQSALDAMIEGQVADVPEVTLWRKTKNEEISNKDLYTSVKVNLITVAGDMSRVYPVKLLWGGYSFAEDNLGCVVDRNTAYALFQTEDIVGMQIDYKSKKYMVRGVMELAEANTMMIQAEDTDYLKENETTFSCMELEFADTENAQKLADSFVWNHELGNPSVYINGYLYQKLADRIVLFPAWLFLIWIMYLCMRKVFTLRGSSVLFIVSGMLVLTLGIALSKLLDFHLYYPTSLIPNRWSEFDFWVNKWNNIRASIIDRESIIQYYKDTRLGRSFSYVLLGSILAVILEGILLSRVAVYHSCVIRHSFTDNQE